MEPTFFSHLVAVALHHRVSFSLATLLVFCSNSLLILNPLLFRASIAFYEKRLPPLHPLFASIFFWMAALFVVALLSGIFKYKMRMIFMLISWEEEAKIRSKLYERIQSQTAAFFDSHPTGDLLSRLTNDLTAYSDVLGPGIMFPLYFVSLTLPAFCALFWISWPMALVASLPLFLLPLIMLTIRSRLFYQSQKVRESLARLSTLAHEYFSGYAIVKSYGIEEACRKKFAEESERLRRGETTFSIWQGLLFPFLSLITRLITILLVLLMALLANYRWEMLSGPDFVSFMWIQSYLFIPILMMGWVFPLYQRGKAAYERLVALYQEPIAIREKASSPLHLSPSTSIDIRGLTFTYPKGSAPVLRDLTVSIPGGLFVGITGPVGVGKTTLFRLLTREYEVPEGTIFFDDHDIHEYPFDAFSEGIVQVEQIPFLFSRTIAENITFGKGSYSQEDIEAVVRATELYETIHGFPFGYETLVGERGVTLSGGERQRMAMARAFLSPPAILLLDDIFSAVDLQTEQRIFLSMREKFRGKTVVFITQRASILQKMDRILYMIDGRIAEEGAPEELQKRPGHYAALLEIQKGSDS